MTKDSIKNNIEGVKTSNIYKNYQKLRENGTLWRKLFQEENQLY